MRQRSRRGKDGDVEEPLLGAGWPGKREAAAGNSETEKRGRETDSLQAAKKQLAGRQQCRYAKKSLLGVASRGLSSSSRPIQPVRSSSISSSSGYGDGFVRRITADDRIRTGISPSYTTKRGISDSDSTYISYGIADRLFTNCSKQADYSISKKLRKADQVPKAESGEEIGEGSGWWYEGESNLSVLIYGCLQVSTYAKMGG